MEQTGRELNLKQELITKLSAFDKATPYVWALKLNATEFNDLASCLDASIKKHGGNKHLLSGSYALYSIIYVAEWYKRKYEDGNQSQELFSIDDIKELWLNSGIDTDKYVYLSDNDQSHRWVDSMNVLGGLPLKMSKNDKRLLKQLFEVYLNDRESAELKASNKSIASQKSILYHHSLFDYYHQVSLGHWPFDEDEIKEAASDVHHFILLAEEAHQPLLRDKIDFEWQVTHFEDCSTMSRSLQLCLKPEEAGDMHSYIWFRRANCWGLEHPEKMDQLRFALRFSKGSQVVHEADYENPVLVFWNSGDDETGFVRFGESRLVEYEDVPAADFNKIELVVFDEKETPLTIKTIDNAKFVDYAQLFREDEGEWTSHKTSQSNQKDSVVLFSKDYTVDADAIHKPFKNNKQQISEPYGWCKIEDEVVLSKDGKEVDTFYNLNGYDKLEVNQYTNIIESHNVVTNNDAVEPNVPLLFRKSDIVVNHYAGQNDTEADLDTKIQKIEWRPSGKVRFSEWTDEAPAEYGAIDIRVTVKGKYLGNKVYSFYYIPGLEAETPIVRDYATEKIRYTTSAGEQVEEALPKQMETYKPLSATHKITIPSGDDVVELNVYRPTLIKEVYADGMIVKYLRDGDALKLPYVLKNRIKICDFNKETGYREYDCTQLTGYFTQLQHGAESDWMKNTQTGRVDNDITATTLDNEAPSYLTVCLGNDKLVQKNGTKLYGWDYDKDTAPTEINSLTSESTSVVFQSLKRIDSDLTCMPPKQKVEKVVASIFGAFAATSSNKNDESPSCCFDVAVDHKTYFFIFRPLAKIKRDAFKTDFLQHYLEEKRICIEDLSNEQKLGILRFAEEIGYEWESDDSDYIQLTNKE